MPISRHRASDERLVTGRPIRHGRLPDGRRSPADRGSRRPGGRLPKLWMAMTLGAAVALGGTLVQSPVTLTGTGELVSNGGFESGVSGWKGWHPSVQPLYRVAPGRTSDHAVKLARRDSGRGVLNDVRSTVESTTEAATYDLSAWVRAPRPGITGQLRIREISRAGSIRMTTADFRLDDSGWQQVSLTHRATRTGSRLDINIIARDLRKGYEMLVDDVSMRRRSAGSTPVVMPPPSSTVTSPTGVSTVPVTTRTTPTSSSTSTSVTPSPSRTVPAQPAGPVGSDPDDLDAETLALGAQWHGVWAEWTDAKRTKVLDTLKANGVTEVRVDIGWSLIQPNAGSYDMSYGVPLVDKVFTMANERGLDVLATFWLTPSWANDGAGTRVLPDDVNDYAKAIKWAASRWKKEVSSWEVWNEPDSEDFLKPPDANAYTKLLKAAYPAVKAGNPDAEVVVGGPQHVNTQWTEKVYKAGARNYFDVMSVHPYMSNRPPEDADDGTAYKMAHTKALINLMKSYSDGDKPIWYTEFGWSVHKDSSSTPNWARGVSEAQQADYLVRSMDYVKANFPQVRKLYWYTAWDKNTGNVHEDGFGMIRRDMSAKPILSAAREYLADGG
jgi:hypothetical protein